VKEKPHMAKKAPATNPLERVLKDLRALRHASARAHKWQNEVNSELRERIGELEATIDELMARSTEDDTWTPSNAAAKNSRLTSPTAT
jgi:hypothetical protein